MSYDEAISTNTRMIRKLQDENTALRRERDLFRMELGRISRNLEELKRVQSGSLMTRTHGVDVWEPKEGEK